MVEEQSGIETKF